MVLARNPGFKRGNMAPRDRLRAGEPAIFLAAFLVSVPLALLTERYAHRTLTGLYDHSASCYGDLTALRGVPAFRDHVDGYTVYEAVQSHEDAALKMGGDLNITPDTVRRALADQAKRAADRYAAAQSPQRRQEALAQIAEARRCLLPPGAAQQP